MKKEYHPLLIICCCFIVVFSCQREISWYFPSEGELAKDIDNNCAPITVNGNYVAGLQVSDSNFLLVDLHITVPGSYTVYTDTINGFYFRATGEIGSAGDTQVKLICAGKR